MNKSQILEVLYDWSPWGKQLPGGITRSLYLDKFINNLGTNLIKVLVGFRRSGKSYLLRQLINYLIVEKKIKPDKILYLNFEDDRLNNYLSLEYLRKIFEIYMQNICPQGKIYIFLDEIQLIPQFEKFLRTLYELKHNQVEIFITGSNSRLLSSEISSSLSGRFIEFMIFPLNFKEFLEFRKISVTSELELIKHQQTVAALFEEYLNYGGLPEIIFLQEREQKINYLRAVFAKIVLDDIVKRFKIREVDIFEKILKYILSNTGQVLNIAKISQYVFGQEKSLGKDLSVVKYIHYAMQAFLFFELEKFDWKTRRVFEKTKKYYTLDLGIRECHKLSLDNDYSKKVENVVFLKFRQQEKKCFYGMDRTNREIDFLVEATSGYDKYQICVNLHQDNCDREVQNFLVLDKYLEQGKNILLTFDQERQMKIENKIIEQKNILKMLLDFN